MQSTSLSLFIRLTILCIVIVAGIAVTMDYYRKRNADRLLHNHVVSTGHAYHISSAGKHDKVLLFRYYADKLRFSDWHFDALRKEAYYELTNRSYPVVYEAGNPSNVRMLIMPEDFKEFGIPFPDSLRWVLPCYR